MTHDKPRWRAVIRTWDRDLIKASQWYSSERQAERLADGMDINLNHEKFFTSVESEAEVD